MAVIHQILLGILRSVGATDFSFTIPAGANRDIRALAISAGWNSSDAVIATLSGAATSTAIGTPAVTISGLFPSGVKFVNSGTITGFNGAAGTTGTHGAAGAGGSNGALTADGSAGGAAGNGGNGGAGGLALLVSTPVTVDNTGSIVRGAGGAAGAAGTRSGGGGGSSSGYSDGYAIFDAPGPGGNGYSVAGGGPFGGGTGPGSGGTGGTGGGSGAAGAAGQSIGLRTPGNGGAGGAAGSAGSAGANGNCITGNANITYINTGTRTGTIT